MFTTPFDNVSGDGAAVPVAEVWPEAVALIPETASNAVNTPAALRDLDLVEAET
ncbi:hypothetical protein ACFMQL_28660 [Nonomuraea fastidiosa]|uniref:hypothetical protein n=1 Tax=Nonomuraea fastidiosa TaxID=46173 RepID=UPI00366EA2AB